MGSSSVHDYINYNLKRNCKIPVWNPFELNKNSYGLCYNVNSNLFLDIDFGDGSASYRGRIKICLPPLENHLFLAPYLFPFTNFFLKSYKLFLTYTLNPTKIPGFFYAIILYFGFLPIIHKALYMPLPKDFQTVAILCILHYKVNVVIF